MKVERIREKLRRFYHYYPGTVAVIGVQDPEKPSQANFMPAVWNVGLSFEPPLFGVAVSPKRHTYRLLTEGRPYSVAFFPASRAELVAELGSISGRETDKVRALGIEFRWGEVLPVPVPAGAYAVYELEPWERFNTGDHDLFVGRVRAVWEEETAFDEDGVPTPDRVRALLYYGRHLYGAPAPEVRRIRRS